MVNRMGTNIWTTLWNSRYRYMCTTPKLWRDRYLLNHTVIALLHANDKTRFLMPFGYYKRIMQISQEKIKNNFDGKTVLLCKWLKIESSFCRFIIFKSGDSRPSYKENEIAHHTPTATLVHLNKVTYISKIFWINDFWHHIRISYFVEGYKFVVYVRFLMRYNFNPTFFWVNNIYSFRTTAWV